MSRQWTNADIEGIMRWIWRATYLTLVPSILDQIKSSTRHFSEAKMEEQSRSHFAWSTDDPEIVAGGYICVQWNIYHSLKFSNFLWQLFLINILKNSNLFLWALNSVLWIKSLIKLLIQFMFIKKPNEIKTHKKSW